MAVRMLLRELGLENIFSFKKTIVELRGLNVLIGPNAVGKSNLIEAISLLKAAPDDLNREILRLGGVRVVCSLAGAAASPIAVIECSGIAGELLRYRLEFSEQASGFVILREHLTDVGADPEKSSSGTYFYRTPARVLLNRRSGNLAVQLGIVPGSDTGAVTHGESVLALYKNPVDPTPITRVGRGFEQIRIYREFRTTGNSQARRGVSTSASKDFLDDQGDNLALVLLDMDFKGLHERVREYLHRFCDRFNDVKVRLDGPIAKTYIEESGLLEPLVSWRLSDGTLKFLCLLAVLLEKEPPPLICIEEPEVGLHPEAIQIVAEALVDASERTQLVVTTHSEALIDALSDRPEDVLVTERDFDNGTQFKRLDSRQLSVWLERYTLGALWRKGEIGGNRW
jgi:predicted ATPase